MNCTVHVRDDGCEVWVGTQVLARAQAAAAKAAGLPLEKVLVHNHLIGGGFGRRLEIDGVARTVEIAKHVDGPVKGVWTREVMGTGAGCGFAGELECDMESIPQREAPRTRRSGEPFARAASQPCFPPSRRGKRGRDVSRSALKRDAKT